MPQTSPYAEAVLTLRNLRQSTGSAYDDLDDETLLGYLQKKHPEYSDLKLPQRQVNPEPSLTEKVAAASGNFARSAFEMVASVPEGLGIAHQRLVDTLRLDSNQAPGSHPVTRAFEGAAKAVRSAEDYLIPPPAPGTEGKFLTEQLPSALGSTAGFALTGPVGRLAGLPRALTIAGVGALSQASSMYKDAKAKGANEDQAYRAFVAGLGLGATEALPIERALGKLGQATGLGKRILSSILEEGAQEAVQQGGQEAAEAVIYDDAKTLGGAAKRTGVAAGLGGLTGGLYAGLGGAIGKFALQVEKAPEAKAQAAATLASDIETLAGHLSPEAGFLLRETGKKKPTAVFSPQQEWAATLPASISGLQARNRLMKFQGMSKAEMDQTGILAFLESKGNKPVSKNEIQKFLWENEPVLREVRLADSLEPKDAQELADLEARRDSLNSQERLLLEGLRGARSVLKAGHGNSPQFARPGLLLEGPSENQREFFVRAPSQGTNVTRQYQPGPLSRQFSEGPNWQDGHEAYSDITNPIVRIRANDRISPDGKKIFFVEELQPPSEAEFAKMPKFYQDNWHDIGVKRVLRYAAENGYDAVAWTTGKQQADRYALSKHLSEVHYSGTNLKAYDHQGTAVMVRTGVTPEELPEHIGKELTVKLLAQPQHGTLRSLTGLDLKIGGEGLSRIYDEKITKAFAKVAGQAISRTGIDTPGEATDSGPTILKQPSITLTPSLRARLTTEPGARSSESGFISNDELSPRSKDDDEFTRAARIQHRFGKEIAFYIDAVKPILATRGKERTVMAKLPNRPGLVAVHTHPGQFGAASFTPSSIDFRGLLKLISKGAAPEGLIAVDNGAVIEFGFLGEPPKDIESTARKYSLLRSSLPYADHPADSLARGQLDELFTALNSELKPLGLYAYIRRYPQPRGSRLIDRLGSEKGAIKQDPLGENKPQQILIDQNGEPISAEGLSPEEQSSPPLDPRRRRMEDFQKLRSMRFLSESVRENADQIVEESAGYEKQRRYAQPVELTEDLGRAYREANTEFMLTSALPEGTTLNAETTAAYVQATEGKLAELEDLSNSDDPDPAAILKATKEAQFLLGVTKATIGENARTLQLIGELTRRQKAVEEALKSGKTLKEYEKAQEQLDFATRRIAKMMGLYPKQVAKKVKEILDATADDPEERVRLLRLLTAPKSIKEKAKAYFWPYIYNNVVSGPKSNERNLIYNTTKMFTEIISSPLAGAASVARSALVTKGYKGPTLSLGQLKNRLKSNRLDKDGRLEVQEAIDKMSAGASFASSMSHISPKVATALGGRYESGMPTILPGETNLGQVSALTSGFVKGIFQAYRIMRHGWTPEQIANLDLGVLGELPGGLATNAPIRFLNAADQLYSAMAVAKTIHGMAYTEGVNSGLTGKALQDFMAERIARPTDEMMETAQNNAKHVLARGEPGDFAKTITSFFHGDFINPTNPGKAAGKAVWSVAGRLLMLFPRTTFNLAKLGAEMSPFGFGMSGAQDFYKTGSRAGAESFGRALMGSALLYPLWLLVNAGWVTGEGPDDPAKREEAVRLGKGPRRIYLNGEWYDYTSWPIAPHLSALANINEAIDSAPDEAAAEEIALMTVKRLGETMFTQDYFQSVTQLWRGLENGKWFSSWLAHTGGMLIPYIGAVRAGAQFLDPTQRTPETVGEALSTDIPILSQSVPPRLLSTGEEAPRMGGSMGAIWALQPSRSLQTATEKELTRLKIPPSIPTLSFDLPEGVTLSREDKFAIKRAKGQAATAAISDLISDPTWAELSDEDKRQFILDERKRAFAEINSFSKDLLEMRLSNDSYGPLTEEPTYLKSLIKGLEKK